MSFPPHGPPMTCPGMPPLPPMMPPPYTMPPMGGMIPMTMGMMHAPMMTHVPMSLPVSMPLMTTSKPFIKKTNITNSVSKIETTGVNIDKSVPKGPPVTVFVGNITERASDLLVRQILQRCGIVMNWKRVQGANGKLQAFGFCEYADPESALRAIRLLHDWDIGDKKLVVKVDAKTKEKLDDYKATKRAATQTQKEKEDSSDQEEKHEKEEDLDEETKRSDSIIKAGIQQILNEHAGELSRTLEAKESPKHKKTEESTKTIVDKDKKNSLDDMELEEDQKSLIHREIDKFRDTYKKAEEENEKEKERRERDRKDRDRDRELRERDKVRERRERREREKSMERSKDRERDRMRERENLRDNSPADHPRERMIDRSRSLSREKERDWSKERERSRERSKDRDRDWQRDKEEDEDLHERRKLERKLREKEAAYQERLRNWESRERRKLKEYEKEKQKEDERRKEEYKEAKRLKEFLEDYDDDRDDPKYYKGNALARRLKEHEKELEADDRDRHKEREEIEELKRRLAEEGHPDPLGEANRIYQEEDAKLMKNRIKPEPLESENEEELPEIKPKKPLVKKEKSPRKELEQTKLVKPIEEDSAPNSLSGFSDVTIPSEEVKPIGFVGLKLGGSSPHYGSRSPPAPTTPTASNNESSSQKKKRLTVEDVFNANEDDAMEQKKRRKLIPLDDTQEDGKSSPSTQQMTTEEKRKHIKNLIDKIPTAKEDLFAYNIDWSLVDNSLMERRIKPWINKKIVEYIGEEEPTLVGFICTKVLAASPAQSILDDVSMVLDEEAEVFVVKMWRLLIYEIEAKKLGLMK
ncbi:RNA-binding protein 25-like [Limulus polyphemus]|uniref:RNA-binding protein 25-like n=1 Tax=Limulus polyphemus TaxID=6850 RepID=A0ABM1B6B1_LIMPO|nr:RNA-binding protein 25-like [Limulus polyphemus]